MRISTVVTATVLAAAGPLAAADLLGGAAWDGYRATASVGPFSGSPEDGGRNQDLIGAGVSLSSHTGYALPNKDNFGWYLGARARVGLYQGLDDSDFYAFAPRISALGGGWWRPSDVYRMEFGPELGLGVAVGQYRAAPGLRNETVKARPYGMIGLGIENVVSLQGGRKLCFGIAWAYEGMAKLRPEGLVLSVSYAWE